jgi:hypothetical protein
MHLLNAHKKQLETFIDTVPSYAILSHTWESDEITYQDILVPTGTAYKVGWRKINFACLQAIKDGFNYVWIDTCWLDQFAHGSDLASH